MNLDTPTILYYAILALLSALAWTRTKSLTARIVTLVILWLPSVWA